MLLSMTGFGDARHESDTLSVVVEIRAVNSRFFKISTRTSEGYAALEPKVETLLRSAVRRGTLQVQLRIHRKGAEEYELNVPLVEAYLDQLAALREKWHLNEQIQLETILLLPGAVQQAVGNQSAEDDWPVIERVLVEAVDTLNGMRSLEGEATAADLRSHCEIIRERLDDIQSRSPIVAAQYEQRLAERVNRSLEKLEVTVEPAELVREVSLFADRSDIAEEVVRLRSHLEQFESSLELSESAGRKLDFITQEMGRETNTIGSKANDTQIARDVVEIKTALERIREQIQNVE